MIKFNNMKSEDSFLFIEDDKLFFNFNVKRSQKFMKNIIKYIYEQFSLNYEKMKFHYSGKKSLLDIDGDICYEFGLPNLQFDNSMEKDDEYFYIFDSEQKMRLKKNCETERIITILHNYLKEHPASKLKIYSINSEDEIEPIKILSINNLSGINQDIRGIRDVDWKLYFWNKYKFTIHDDIESVSFEDLVIACYKIKSHKFDNWYELFININQLTYDDSKIEFGAVFDHGS